MLRNSAAGPLVLMSGTAATSANPATPAGTCAPTLPRQGDPGVTTTLRMARRGFLRRAVAAAPKAARGLDRPKREPWALA